MQKVNFLFANSAGIFPKAVQDSEEMSYADYIPDLSFPKVIILFTPENFHTE